MEGRKRWARKMKKRKGKKEAWRGGGRVGKQK
jgi:hypothetical protein